MTCTFYKIYADEYSNYYTVNETPFNITTPIYYYDINDLIEDITYYNGNTRHDAKGIKVLEGSTASITNYYCLIFDDGITNLLSANPKICAYVYNGTFRLMLGLNRSKTSADGNIFGGLFNYSENTQHIEYLGGYAQQGNASITQDGETAWVYSYDYGANMNNYQSLIKLSPYTNVTQFNRKLAWVMQYSNSISPTPTINWGDVADVSFTTQIAGQGEAAKNNIDVITYNPDIDSNGNPYPDDARIQIAVVAGQYTGSSKEDLLLQRWEDLPQSNLTPEYIMLNEMAAVSTGTYLAHWDWVIEKCKLQFTMLDTFLYAVFMENTWQTSGWIYKIRWTSESADYTSNWQTIRTGATEPADKDVIVNSTQIDNTLITTITNINTTNNTTENWTYQSIEIEDTTDLTTVEKLLKQIRDLEQKIYNWLISLNDNNGTNETVINDNDTVINNAVDQEDDYITDLDTKLKEIDTDTPQQLMQNNNLVSALNWIKEVHRQTVDTTILGQVTVLVLLIGLTIYLIGRRG